MNKFVTQKRCTIYSVNSELKLSGFLDTSIFRDAHNDGRISISHECTDRFGQVSRFIQRTNVSSAREWAELFAAGELAHHVATGEWQE
ncbi:hypothetical protein [Burkholderia pseudomallei]|uniref:hypothetical protein n=1 Tax=Burkholderia pseudomallei TaxID=28450 RepID=UPI0027E1E715|nr:hypothetical protein [Burkholderia pseudomallei]